MRDIVVALVVVVWLVPASAYADVVDVTDLSSLPVGVTAAFVDGDLTVTVDGVITRAFVETYLTVDGALQTAPFDFITGTLFHRDIPDTVLGGYEVSWSATELNLDFGFPDIGLNYLRASAYHSQPRAIHHALSNALGVDEAVIDYGFRLTEIDYTPTSVPEPSTWLLSWIGALLVLRRHGKG